jgi:hypothetical protein
MSLESINTIEGAVQEWKHEISPDNFKLLKSIFEYIGKTESIDDIPESDLIFIFGHVDPKVAEHASELFHAGKAGKILISGGIGSLKRQPGGFPTEADYYEDILINNGVPKENIFKESTATNALENVTHGMERIESLDLKSDNMILVSMPVLSKRAVLTFKKHFPDANIVPSTFEVSDDEIAGGLSTKISRVVAEIDRLIEYGEKGDIEKTDIPQEILDAHEQLKAAGYKE